jgi:hypothetical protein
MKKTLQYIVVFLTAIILYSCSDGLSDFQKQSFIKFYGSHQVDVGQDVVQLVSGDYALTGTMIPGSVPKMFLILTDENGNQKDTSPVFYGGDYRSAGSSLIALLDEEGNEDGFLIAGQITDSFVITVGEISDTILHTDIFIVRTDPEGIEEWTKQIGGDGNESASHVVERSSGGFVIAGKTEVNDQEDLWVVMIDEEGNLISDITGNNGTQDDEANYIYNTGIGYLVACSYNDAAFDGKDFMVLNIDENCNLIDARSMGTDADDNAKSIAPYNGAFLLMGYSEYATGNSEIALYTFSMESNLIKNPQPFATIEEPGVDLIGEACAVTSNGTSIAVAGCYVSNENKDMLLQFIEGKDIIGDTITFGQLGNQSGFGIKNTLDGGLILIGSNGLEGNSVISLVKTNARGKF